MNLLKAKATPWIQVLIPFWKKRPIARLGSNDNSNKTETLSSEDIRTWPI